MKKNSKTDVQTKIINQLKIQNKDNNQNQNNLYKEYNDKRTHIINRLKELAKKAENSDLMSDNRLHSELLSIQNIIQKPTNTAYLSPMISLSPLIELHIKKIKNLYEKEDPINFLKIYFKSKQKNNSINTFNSESKNDDSDEPYIEEKTFNNLVLNSKNIEIFCVTPYRTIIPSLGKGGPTSPASLLLILAMVRKYSDGWINIDELDNLVNFSHAEPSKYLSLVRRSIDKAIREAIPPRQYIRELGEKTSLYCYRGKSLYTLTFHPDSIKII